MWAYIEEASVKGLAAELPDVWRGMTGFYHLALTPLDLAEYGWLPVREVRDEYDSFQETLSEPEFTIASDHVVATYAKRHLREREIADFNEEQRRLRERAYRVESDGLFFEVQRGEAVQSEWRERVAKIKARY